MEGLGCDKPNRLARERSPYLRQHACNPVDWRPWGREALEEARRLGKPLFISIGYSTCHWCHVMARESFSDPGVAEVLNRVFVPVKVDREEMPDVDSYYMSFCMAVSGSCGWPLNVAATPDGRPFFVATYMPREALVRVALEIERRWRESRGDLEEIASRAAEALKAVWSPRPAEVGVDGLMARAYRGLAEAFDPLYGGFGYSPKFPSTPLHNFLLVYWWLRGDEDALSMVSRTLHYMIAGGIHDVVGGGFHRYSTDRQWLLPHFEKMLYDQGLMLWLMSSYYMITRDEVVARASRWLVEFLSREMASPEGAFYSALDAESGGVEGGYYTWTAGELEEVLGGDYGVAARLFNVRREGNYLDEATRARTGRNILYIGEPLRGAAERLGVGLRDLLGLLERLRASLLEARRGRVPPARDEKILADWNGIAILGLSHHYKATGHAESLRMAEAAADFILSRMMDGDSLLHAYKDGEAYIDGMLGDYAYLSWGLMSLYEASLRESYLEASLELAESIRRLFMDGSGLLRLSRGDLGVVEVSDYSIPSPYSVAIEVMVRAARIRGDEGLEEDARRAARAVAGVAGESPVGSAHYIVALAALYKGTYEVVVSGDPAWSDFQEKVKALNALYNPLKTLLASSPRLARIAGYTRSMPPLGGKTAIYVCRNKTCDLPTTSLEAALKSLSTRPPRG